MIYIIGVDPGLCNTGWAIIDFKNQNDINLIKTGTIKTIAQEGMANRLKTIYNDLNNIFIHYTINKCAIEKTLVNTNAHSSIDLAMAKSIVLLLFAQHNVPYTEYAPTNVKKTITGNGKADKTSVMKMIGFYIKSIKNADSKLSHHEFDSIAIALCSAFNCFSPT